MHRPPDGAGEVCVVPHCQRVVPPVQGVWGDVGAEVLRQLHGLGGQQHQGLEGQQGRSSTGY